MCDNKTSHLVCEKTSLCINGGIFRTKSKVQDEMLCKSCQQLQAIKYFHKKSPSEILLANIARKHNKMFLKITIIIYIS